MPRLPLCSLLLLVFFSDAAAQQFAQLRPGQCMKQTTVDAGPDLSSCIDPPGITLSGSVSGGSRTGVWSTAGDGHFNEHAVAINAVYHPGPKDMANRSVVLYLTSTHNGACAEVSDQVTINMMPLPQVTVTQAAIPRADGTIGLHGNVSDGAIAQWSTEAPGEFMKDGTSVETSFRIDPAHEERELKFVLQARNGCGITSDTIQVHTR